MTIFDTIYRGNLWNGEESLSGPGSGASATMRVAPAITALVEELDVRSVLDVACGDGYWMPDLPGYLGIDVSAEAIRRARKLHPERSYRVTDVRTASLQAFDLVIVRDVIQHHSLTGGQAILDAVARTGSRWMLASTYVAGENFDVPTGDCYWPDLTALPFFLGVPERLIFDGYGYADPDEIRDPRKHLGLWPL